jgi:hypothetical protein
MTFMAFDFTHAFLDYSRAKLIDESWRRMRVTVESLTDDQIWWRPNEASNSIGNLLLHLNGNVRQWLVTSFNQHIDARQRPAEFAERDHLPVRTLLERLGATLDEAALTLGRLTAPLLPEAVREQLGLELKPVKNVPIDVVVLDSANQAPTEN